MKAIAIKSALCDLILLYCVISTTYLLMMHHEIDVGRLLTTNVFDTKKINSAESVRYNRRSLYSIEIEPEISIQTIVMWAGRMDEIPTHWALCNGENNTPNLTNKFVIAASDLYPLHSIGGHADIQITPDQMPLHSHDLTNDSFSIEDDGEHYHYISKDSVFVSNHSGHQHIVSTDNISMNGDHSHAVGNYYITNNGTQSPFTIDTSSLSVTSSGSHTHSVGGSAANSGNHQHQTSRNVVAGIGPIPGVLGFAAQYEGTNPTTYAGTHSHSVSGTAYSSGAHTHEIHGSVFIGDVSMEGESASDGTHNHKLYTISDVNGGHQHVVDGQTESIGAHAHEVDYGWTEAAGEGEKVDVMNPYYALAFIMKISDSSSSSESEEAIVMDVDHDGVSSDHDIGSNSTVMWVLTGLVVVLMIMVCVICYWCYGQKREEEVDEYEKSPIYNADTSISSVAKPADTGIYCEKDDSEIDDINSNVGGNDNANDDDIEMNEIIKVINTSEGL